MPRSTRSRFIKLCDCDPVARQGEKKAKADNATATQMPTSKGSRPKQSMRLRVVRGSEGVRGMGGYGKVCRAELWGGEGQVEKYLMLGGHLGFQVGARWAKACLPTSHDFR